MPICLENVSAAQEQAWNREKLAFNVREPEFRLWAYREPAVVLGCSASGDCEIDRCSDVDILVRGSGGGAVLTGPWMLSASVVLPSEHDLSLRGALACYRWLGDCFVQALSSLGATVRSVTPEEARTWQVPGTAGTDISWACFGGLSPWEVVAGNRKLVGFAQMRRRNGVLLVAGVLLEPPDWTLLCRELRRPFSAAGDLRLCTTSVAEEVGFSPSLCKVADSLGQAIRRVINGHEA